MMTVNLPGTAPQSAAGFFERGLPVLMAIALGLIVTMASITALDRHPDESYHYAAAKYFFHHWLPPAVGDPEALEAYSQYGRSYLDDQDPVYFLAAKFANLLAPLVQKPYLALRFFNVALFLFLLGYCWYFRDRRLVFLVLLITPQVWYIFSYFNNDALPLFLTCLIIGELVSQGSWFNRFLSTGRNLQNLGGGIWLGGLVGLLSLGKKNYYIFLLFFSGWILAQIFQAPRDRKKIIISKYGLVIGLAAFIFLLNSGGDLAINGWDKAAKVVAAAEQTAAPEYKPSQRSLQTSYFGLNLRGKGVKYNELFSSWKWHIGTCRSFFGVYGYMLISSAKLYYKVISGVFLSMIAYIFLSIFLRGKSNDKLFLVWVIGVILLAIFISSYHSWIADFQAQGRYLFPLLSIIGLAIYQNKKILNKSVLAIFVGILFLLSVNSFVFTGLARC